MPNYDLSYNFRLVHDVRMMLGLTQTELSDLIGVTQPVLSRYETSRTLEPRIERIAILYNICAQNGIERFPLFVRDGKVVDIAVQRHYQGPYTIGKKRGRNVRERIPVIERRQKH